MNCHTPSPSLSLAPWPATPFNQVSRNNSITLFIKWPRLPPTLIIDPQSTRPHPASPHHPQGSGRTGLPFKDSGTELDMETKNLWPSIEILKVVWWETKCHLCYLTKIKLQTTQSMIFMTVLMLISCMFLFLVYINSASTIFNKWGKEKILE